MPALTDLRPFLRHLDSLNRHDPADYVDFLMQGVVVGRLKRAFCDVLRAYSDTFAIADNVRFLPDGSQTARTNALGAVVEDLVRQGHFSLRNEPYPVTAGWGQEVLATIDRGAYQFFGTLGFGVHVNGLVNRHDGRPCLWVARRARDRAVAPGKLDNIIAGGLSSDHTAYETLIKEAGEEAGFSPETADRAHATGFISYAYDMSGGIKRDTLFIYDLTLSEDIVPFNRDGEVESFELIPIVDVIDIIRDTDDFKLNVNAVIIDLLVRLGVFTPDMPGYERLVAGLRRRK